MGDQEEHAVVVVVAQNKPRLNKIMALAAERLDSLPPEPAHALPVELVPCLAALGSYEGQDGNNLRYLSNFVYHDGSAMTQFLDDPTFRNNLVCVLQVGYEWHDGDEKQIASYFELSDLHIPVKCVMPMEGQESLYAEMEHFKKLDETEKNRHQIEGTMGPGKMARFVVDQVQGLKQSAVDKKKEEEEAFAKSMAQVKIDPEEPEEETKKIEPADPTRIRFACRKCRTILLGENHLAQEHEQAVHALRRNHDQKSHQSSCQSLFCSDDVLAWLSPSGDEIEGNLTCPRCTHKIGHWRWAGAQCSCGTWITPAIQIPKSKVDDVFPAASSATVTMPGVVQPALSMPR
eukprot:Nitzschia sp. Nitz4//scaffold64_size103689//14838//15875//NITZ4_004422-RA/size103689-processed-gene-0.71-mRNA-1//1//CDS//3329556088//8249//frame0